MKRIYDFVYCDGMLSQDTVFYSVAVGRSERDQRALSFVRSKLIPGKTIFALHSGQFVKFMFLMEQKMFKNAYFTNVGCSHYLRRIYVQVTWLAYMLRNHPPTLLNSKKIPTNWPMQLLSGTSKVKSQKIIFEKKYV